MSSKKNKSIELPIMLRLGGDILATSWIEVVLGKMNTKMNPSEF